MDYKQRFSNYLTLGLLVIATGGLMSCSKSSGSSTPTASDTPATVDPETDELTRRCRIPVRYTDAAAHTEALEALVQANVDRKERPTTMCVAAEASPLKKFDASLRFEYEDNYGLRWVTFRKRDLVYSNQSNNVFRIIYLDIYGYVDLNVKKNSAGNYTGTAKLADVDSSSSYLDDIDAYLDYIRATCTASPTKCLNPIFVTPSAPQPPTDAQILQQANDAIAGLHGATPHTLGTVTFSPSDIESVLF